ncbi:DUF2203 domain-containing protein [Bdellovibrio reynosensis]|uniref:DUF2203 domain-containing protein n=1 Tax=Bdellovibrio reynosensis TaxID=2835041 RepID=A0ABY4C678_9BACT|nr:DUF2203 domain-containing protein [Bdellovibrio reynosensis]UOF00471.1 DUF2203 domain-containing protein [Bdellovibrio reynosensis]
MGDLQLENVVEINRKNIFTLQEARALLPLIYRMTDDSSREVKSQINKIEAFSDKSHPSVGLIELEINAIIDRWQRKLQKLGASPKGLWMADFDNGDGYFCWKYPEVEINHWHGYQDGFSGRILVE